MESIGSFLQEKRKEKNLSLEEISSTTRLQVNILKSIEENEFSRLGGSGYTKILISTYARVLGLDRKEIDQLLSRAPEDQSKAPRQPKEVLNPPTILIHKNLLLLLLLLVLIVVLSLTIIRLYREDRLIFPFRNNSLLEESADPSIHEQDSFQETDELPLEDPQGRESEPAADLQPDAESIQITEVQAEPTEPVKEETEEKPLFVTDRTDYISSYQILSGNRQDNREEEDYFARYIKSF